MITAAHHQGEHFGRSLSYNDLKKRRMLRSNTNQGKINTIKDNLRYRHHQDQMKQIRMSDNINYLPKIASISKQSKNRYDLNEIQINQDFSKQQPQSKQLLQQKHHDSNNIMTQSQKPHDLKKLLSIKPLTKKSYNISSKLYNIDPLKKPIITSISTSKPNQTPPSLSNYKTNFTIKKYLYQLNNSSQHFKQKQNIFFNAISPIPQKQHKIPGISKQQISGFSILLNIQGNSSILKQSQMQSIPTINHKNKSNKYQENKHRLYALQPELKINKIMKKHLPKDFFLRV